jgi:hypothetical protein
MVPGLLDFTPQRDADSPRNPFGFVGASMHRWGSVFG